MNIENLRGVAERATKGRWHWSTAGTDLRSTGPRGEILLLPIKSNGTASADADFISTFSPEVILNLLDLIEENPETIERLDRHAEVREELAQMRAQLDEMEKRLDG